MKHWNLCKTKICIHYSVAANLHFRNSRDKNLPANKLVATAKKVVIFLERVSQKWDLTSSTPEARDTENAASHEVCSHTSFVLHLGHTRVTTQLASVLHWMILKPTVIT